jgi:2-oxoisovalerate ferredoxin oxidoreductase beta subunit
MSDGGLHPALEGMEILQEKAAAFYGRYERKPELQHQTHYCPGCGHGVAHKLLARAIDELGVQDRAVLVSPVGCSVFAYYYFDVGNVQVAHGRAPAVATGIKRARPEAVVISYQGDGDLAAIGTAEILHAANRGEPITVIFINNAIYGMTGGQLAPTTPVGAVSTTSPYGRSIWNEGYPLHVVETLASLEAPVYLERVALGNAKQVMQAAKAIRRGLENQVKGLGFSLIEVLSPCPTIWNETPVEAQRRVREEMAKIYPLGVVRDKTGEAPMRPARKAAPALSELPKLLDIEENGFRGVARAGRGVDWRIKVAGFGGQGVLMLGEVLAEAGLEAGLEVSWLPSYGPEMRSGTSNCHVRLSGKPVDSPLVAKPNVLIALNEPSLRKFVHEVVPGGYVLYNGAAVPEDCRRSDARVIAGEFARIADELGSAKAGNVVALGALLEAANVVEEEFADRALTKLVKKAGWLELDRKALQAGRGIVRKEGRHDNE